jgi:phosphoglycolate phosphatase-like HAD superfamily hydrolase
MIHPHYDGRMTDRRRAGLDLAPGEVVLDWNGTVVADRSRAVEATNAVLAAHGRPPITGADFGRLFSLPLRRFLSRLSVPASALADAEASWNLHSAEREAELSQGALELLMACQRLGVNVGILTAADPGVVHADAGRLGIRSLLAWISGPSQDKAAELQHRAAIVGRVLYVGDTADDICYARRAGTLAVAFTGGYHDADQLRSADPDLVVDDLTQLIPLLR